MLWQWPAFFPSCSCAPPSVLSRVTLYRLIYCNRRQSTTHHCWPLLSVPSCHYHPTWRLWHCHCQFWLYCFDFGRRVFTIPRLAVLARWCHGTAFVGTFVTTIVACYHFSVLSFIYLLCLDFFNTTRSSVHTELSKYFNFTFVHLPLPG